MSAAKGVRTLALGIGFGSIASSGFGKGFRSGLAAGGVNSDDADLIGGVRVKIDEVNLANG